MPYHRYEADQGDYGGGAILYTNPDLDQALTSSEASDYRYVGLPTNGAFVEWTLAHDANGVTLRFTMPDAADGEGLEGSLDLYINDELERTIDLTSYWAWQYFPNSEPENEPGRRPRMRFDEVHFLTARGLSPGDRVKIQKNNGDGLEYGVDFIEIERVAPPKPQPPGFVNVTDFGAAPNDGQDDLPAFQAALAAAGRAGTGVYVPAGQFTLDNKLLFETSNIAFKGAGMWHTELFFSREGIFTGGILARASDVELSDFYLNTVNNQRFINGAYVIYKGFMGTYGNNSSIHDTWVTHFEVGAWIAGYDPPYPIDITQRLTFRNNRIRNNYADGINLCQGTSNSVVAQNNFRSNGDDAMAVWPNNAQGAPVAVNNIFRFNTVENNYRAGGAAIFGGDGHEVHHCIIKDGLASSGLRLTTDFPGYHFENTQAIRFYENTLINVGTSTDLFGPERGAIEVNATNFPIKNIFFENIDIVNAQRHGIQIGSNSQVDLQFDNININGTGIDPVTDAKYTIPTDGAAIMAYARQGTSVFNNLTLENIERDPAVLKAFENYNLIFGNTTVPLSGISLPVEELSLISGETRNLTVRFNPANANNKSVSWESSDETVAVYDEENARVVARGVGTATITVRSEEGGFEDAVVVSVEAAVSIVASSGGASEDGRAAAFTISIPELANSVTVGYEIGGSAEAGDYVASPTLLSGSVSLSPDNLSQTITITPVDDELFEGEETLELTLSEGTGYRIGSPESATIVIADNERPGCTSPVIAFTSVAPIIGGRADGAWETGPLQSIEKSTIGGLPTDFSGSWRALYDSDNLYVLVTVADATLTNDSGAEWWNDDVVEIFIDGDNNKGSSYDGINDIQFGFRWDDATVRAGGNSVQNTAGVEHVTFAVPGGYVLEAAIPWSVIGRQPTLGALIGFDVAVDDDDNGGARDAQVASLATSAQGWTDPSVFGSVFLTVCDEGDGNDDDEANAAPIASAGQDVVLANDVTSVSLRGSGSDPDGDAITYAWAQTAGPAATLAQADRATGAVSGLVPGATYTFTLTVSDGELTANDAVTVTVRAADTGTPPAGTFTIRNVWSNDYLSDGGANATYGSVATGDAYYWVLEEVGDFTEIRNVATGHYLHIEDRTGRVQSTPRTPGWWSSQWAITDAGDGSVRINNRWQRQEFVHVQDLLGSAQSGSISPAWESAKWLLEGVSSANQAGGALRTELIGDASNSIALYPNPTGGKLRVQFVGDVATVSVMDLQGRQVLPRRTLAPGSYVDVSQLRQGTYVVAFDQAGTKVFKRFVKQ